MSRFLLVAALALPLAACADNEPDTAVDTTDPIIVDTPDPVVVDDNVSTAGTMNDEVTLDGTIEAAGTDLTALDPAAALSNIDGWISRLDGADFTNAAEIREGLMTLQNQLQTTPLDGAAIGGTLSNLGEWTAASAPDNEQIQTLAGALSAGGSKLTGM